MTRQVHLAGQEFYTKLIFNPGEITRPASLQVGLFNDATDQLVASDDLGQINTEPTTGSYARQAVPFDPPTGFNSTDFPPWGADMQDLTFNITGTTGTVDSYFLAGEFVSEEKGDVSSTLHLLQSIPLGRTDNLADSNQYDLVDGGVRWA